MRLHEQRKFQQSEFELRNTLASLKSEEEKTKLKTEMKLSREKLGAIRRESEDLRRKYGQVDTEMKAEIQKGLRSVEEMLLALQGVLQKEMLEL